MTNVLRFPAAEPAVAAAFFAAELAFEVDPDDVVRDMKEGTASGYVLVEARGREAFDSLRIPGAVNLPYWEVGKGTRLDPELVYVCYCESFQCNAATKGALKLAELGYRVKRLAGGITAWRDAGYPVEGTGAQVACNC